MTPIITAPLSAARHIQCDERWLITRVEAKGEGILWVPELAPSQRLYGRYMGEWKGLAAERYWDIYVDAFNEELKMKEKLGALRKLWKLSSEGISVALLCYCPKPTHCHRSLIADFLRLHGAVVTEYVPRQDVLFGDPVDPVC